MGLVENEMLMRVSIALNPLNAVRLHGKRSRNPLNLRTQVGANSSHLTKLDVNSVDSVQLGQFGVHLQKACFTDAQATNLERWQSGRMRST